MNLNDHVPLERHFSPVPRSEHDTDELQILEVLGYEKNKGWPDLDKRYRTVILAEAGAGKTHEMFTHARIFEVEGHHAFFIRIEDIHGDFEQAFGVGNVEGFEQWLYSQNEAWFFLDSVDDARLSDPRDFEKAIRRFATAIKPARQRAHICISSRPYAWRPKSDPELIKRYLPYMRPKTEITDQDLDSDEPSGHSENELEIMQMDPLDEQDIRRFAEHRSISRIDDLIEELERSNVMTLAARPFDLDGILHKWKTEHALGGRTELLEHNIELRLTESEPDNKILRPLNPGKAREGARILAAAVILCDKPGIQVPDNTHEKTGIKADAILSNWEPRDIQTLLERAIFNDVIYGSVRFRHREIREFLVAEWFVRLLKKGTARHAIESLFFRKQYGETIVSPRLRPILPWLILKDEQIRNRALALHPEIAVEGGDPERLPISERKDILNRIVVDIVGKDKSSSAQDNSAIARIAQSDLTDETLSLIIKYGGNDDAIFFLGRVVWQGKMHQCVPPLLTIAIDPERRISTRMAAIRAVMSCGTDAHRSSLWNEILKNQGELSRKLLAELLQGTSADLEGVAQLLAAIEKLHAYNRFDATGLRQALHGYINRLPIPNPDSYQPLANLVDGIGKFLDRQPHIERLSCRISQEFAWLLNPAIHAVERLVSEHADAALQESAIEILLNSPAIRESSGERFDDYKDNLKVLVPAWSELNDTLFWRRVEKRRACIEGKGKQLNNFLQITSPDHYWSFTSESFPRVLDWVKTRELEDDRLVALSLAFHLFTREERPDDWFDQFHAAVKGDTVLETQLNNLLHPTMPEEVRKWQEEELKWEEESEHQQIEKKQNRSDWIKRLKADPNLVRNPPGLEQGDISYDQFWLMREIEGDGMLTKRVQSSNWKFLIDEFGDDVARAYRDAAMRHWRVYDPGLPSESADTSSIPYSLSFALTGLDIESREFSEFPNHLMKSDINHALRYITWEMNGFPGWLEAMYRAKPEAVMEAIQTEIYWELDNTKPDQKSYGLLHDLTNYAPWLHQALIEPLLTWLGVNEPPNTDTLRYCLHILKSGGIYPDELGILAKQKVSTVQCDELLSQWYAAWIDSQPELGIPALSEWLSELDTTRSSRTAQLFITTLMGIRYHSITDPSIGLFRKPEHLKTLYVLMHEYIRVEDDIDRANKGVYSPELRDHAQRARDRIFKLLSEFPGKETYVALTELTEEHPNTNYRPWMKELAYKRAEEDGDLEPWTAAQVSEFGTRLTRTPVTQRQLFDLTVDRLLDLKNWLERGDTSPYATWKKAGTETEMRNLVAGQLQQHAENRFMVSQEDEVANRQRMDIRMHNPNSGQPIPIELKLLDNGWSGTELCEGLSNQLIGDYLRDGTGRFGVMLLIRCGSETGKSKKRWKVDGKFVGIDALGDALMTYWHIVSGQHSNVDSIELIVIDLTVREIKSTNRKA